MQNRQSLRASSASGQDAGSSPPEHYADARAQGFREAATPPAAMPPLRADILLRESLIGPYPRSTALALGAVDVDPAAAASTRKQKGDDTTVRAIPLMGDTIHGNRLIAFFVLYCALSDYTLCRI